jgi:hypothetical protein
MAEEQWLLLPEVVDLIRQHYGTSVGRSQALARKAVESGEVRESGEICPYDPVVIDQADGPVHLAHDDGVMSVDTMPNAGILRGLGLGIRRRLNRADLLDWLGRQVPIPMAEPGSTKPAARSREKRDRALRAIAALWPAGVPSKAELPNQRLVHQASRWLANQHISAPSKETILRAAKRIP